MKRVIYNIEENHKIFRALMSLIETPNAYLLDITCAYILKQVSDDTYDCCTCVYHLQSQYFVIEGFKKQTEQLP